MKKTKRNLENSAQENPSAKPSKLIGLMLVGLFSLTIFYIFQINYIASSGYTISELESSNAKLQEENDNLRIKTAYVRSVNSLQEDNRGADDLKMEKPAEVEYLDMDGSIAMLK